MDGIDEERMSSHDCGGTFPGVKGFCRDEATSPGQLATGCVHQHGHDSKATRKSQVKGI